MSTKTFRAATKSDTEAISNLVNRAYRPDADFAGWTHESLLVAGNRINVTQVSEIMAKPDSAVLIGLNDSELVACIHVEKNGDSSYIGMFAVNPLLQGAGVGKTMLAHAEQYAKNNFGSSKYCMVVMSDRSELISFYQRRGYQKTGMVMDYPLAAGAGTPKHADTKIEVLVKQV
jgi:ribosomal protein S18 acetylase RimI-like enzyme